MEQLSKQEISKSLYIIIQAKVCANYYPQLGKFQNPEVSANKEITAVLNNTENNKALFCLFCWMTSTKELYSNMCYSLEQLKVAGNSFRMASL